MSHTVCTRSLIVVLFFLGCAVSSARAQEEAKEPLWSHAFDLACRKFGEPDFTKDTKKWGIEVLKDMNNGLGVYICQTGDIAIAGNFAGIKPPLTKSEVPMWTGGLDLQSRKAGELEFTDTTKTYGLEVFYDKNAGNWVYISETGNIATAAGAFKEPGSLEAPKWLYSYDLKSRKGGEKKFTDKTTTYGIEVYDDVNTGNLVYICQTGAMAVIPKSQIGKVSTKEPLWLHGQDLQCRKVGEKAFSKDTKKFGVEIFRDGHNDNLIFLSESGHIAVIAGRKARTEATEKAKDAQFTHGLDLRVRQAGEKDFRPTTKTYAMEVFHEPNVEATLYICETGAISALVKK